ncbi:anti-sigma factor family protein [Microbispora sp. CA-102843]|uniref:anti-sigma factor family protein n=1 Tax=Microbispora sp. CA-102843 TaxID=3239952 RepID=UPI003D92531B
MTCEEVRISLGAHVLGALDDEEAAEVEAHLETCAACRAELAELSGLPPLLARVSAEDIERAAAPPRAVLDGVFADVLAGAAAAEVAPAAVAPARRGRRSRVLLALAASVVVAAVGGTAWVSAAQNASERTAVGSAAAAPDLASRASQGEASQDQLAQAQAGQADQPSAEALQEPFFAPASPAPSAASSKGAVARKVEPPRADATVTASPEAGGRSGDVRMAVRLVPHDGGTQVVARVAGVPAGTVCTLRAVAKDGTVSTLGSWTVGRGEYRGQKMVLEGSTALRTGQIDRIELADSGGRVLVTARL